SLEFEYLVALVVEHTSIDAVKDYINNDTKCEDHVKQALSCVQYTQNYDNDRIEDNQGPFETTQDSGEATQDSFETTRDSGKATHDQYHDNSVSKQTLYTYISKEWEKLAEYVKSNKAGNSHHTRLGQIFHILMYDDCNQPQCNEIFEKLQLVTLYRTINEYLALYGHTDITDTRLSMYNAFEEIVKSSIKATSTAYGNSAAKILSTAKQLASENLVKYKIVADILNLAQMSTADTPEHDIASIYLDYLIEPFRENSMFTELTLRGKDLEFVKGLLGYVKIIVANDDCKGMIEILIDYTLRNCFEYQDWCDRLASVSSDFSNGLMFATHEEFMRKCRSCLSGEDYRNLQDSRECITSHQAKILFSIVQLANSSKTPDTIGKVIALLSNPGFGKTQLVLYVIIHLALMGHKIGLSTTNTIDYDNYRRDIKVDKPEVSKSEVDKPKVSKSTALTASANMYDALFIQENPRPRPSLRPNGGGG
ncbi:MAG: hypothetical protein EBY83_06735, partial [Verrucomicrobia bacterium]|nr:hypothetical protein [Verrucomicrobiota bacterium]